MPKPLIGIIGGKGQMGKLFASFFVETGHDVLVSDLKTKLNNVDVARKADITILSVPIEKTVQVIKEILPYVPEKSLLTDLTSIKENPLKTMLRGKCEVLGMHPMFGSSNPIPGQTIIFCRTKKSGKWSKYLENLFKSNDVKIFHLNPREHDKLMSVVQVLIHFSDISFVDSLKNTEFKIDDVLKFTSRASELKIQSAGRILDQDSSLYGNITLQNPFTAEILKKYQKSVNELAEIVHKKDLAAYRKYFAKSQKYLGPYTKKAYQESAYLIDKLIEMRERKDLNGSKNHQGFLNISKNKISKSALALLGPSNTFSDLAADKYLAQKNTKNFKAMPKYFTKDIDEVFELVEKGRVQEGILPIENMLHGTIRETLDNLFLKNVHITKEIRLPIHHSLIILKGSRPDKISRILSHSQALHQCKKYLRKNFPNAEAESFSSTSSAIEKLLFSRDETLAVIAPETAAQNPALKIIAKNIEDEKDNATTFVVIERGSLALENPAIETSQNFKTTHTRKTAIAFHFSKDAPGSLFQIFEIFAHAKINLTKIESRPSKKQFGDYIFYLDFDGGINDRNVQSALKKITQKVATLKILGSY